jgi:hypothetical protein
MAHLIILQEATFRNYPAIPNLKSDKPKIGESNHHDKANVSLLGFSLCKCHTIQSEGAILPRF